MPGRFRLRAYAKINLGLKILGRRADGFHELRTVFQTLALADRLEVELSPGRGIELTITGERERVAEGTENLAWRAAALAAEAWGIRGRIAIRLEKHIPSGAGLGGGSSDAAAVLRALAQVAVHGQDGALQLAAQLGSDVAPLLIGGAVLGLGRGEEAYALSDLGSWHCVLAMPREGPGGAVATADAFAAWDKRGGGLTPPDDLDTIMKFCNLVHQVLPAFRLRRNRGAPSASLRGTGGPKVHAGIENDFQEEVFSLSPDFPRIHQALLRSHAIWVSLTGSGAAQFGLFANAAAARRAAAKIAARDRIWTTRFVDRAEFERGLQVVD